MAPPFPRVSPGVPPVAIALRLGAGPARAVPTRRSVRCFGEMAPPFPRAGPGVPPVAIALRFGAGPAKAAPTRRSVRRIFPAARVAGKMIRILSGAGAGNQEGASPSWTFPRGTRDESPRSAACFCWKRQRSGSPLSGIAGERPAPAGGRRSPVGCLLLLEAPAIRLAAGRLWRWGFSFRFRGFWRFWGGFCPCGAEK